LGHTSDMINRIKMNDNIKKRRDFIPSNTSSKDSKIPFNFKQPTEEELKKLEIKNRQFLNQQKRTRRFALSISLVFALAIMSWIFFYWPWSDMVVGFMKGYGK